MPFVQLSRLMTLCLAVSRCSSVLCLTALPTQAAAFQEYETLPEEGTRAEQLAKQQKNLKQRSVLLTELPLCSHPMQKC